MQGINWADLFSAMDQFLLALAGQYGAWVYFTLFCIFFSETGLVFMAFLPGDSLLFVAGAVAATGVMNIWVLMAVVFFVAGCLEIISIVFRPVSLSFRLYGNIYAGENMLETMADLVPGFGWLIPIPFYFLELLVGLVQALVFMLLTAVFTLLICQHEAVAAAVARD